MRSPSAHIIGAAVFVALGLGTLPGLLQAQVSESLLLREEIRSALLSDPRTSELSSAELNLIIEALAGEVEATGQTEDFTSAHVFYEELVPYPDPESRIFISEAMLYGIVIVALGLALLALRRAHELHHQEPTAQA